MIILMLHPLFGCKLCRYSLGDKAQQAGKVTPELAAEYKALKHHASECVQCGQCEGRCPFNVAIREKMKEAVKVFGY